MEIELDLIIQTPPSINEVDMKSALDTMQGISDSVRTISETVVTKHLPEKKSSKNKIRTTMKNSFSGSYGLNFSVVAYDDAKESAQVLGKNLILELIEYYLAEALDTDSKQLSPQAEKLKNELGELSVELISVLRGTMLRSAHKVTQNFGYPVKIRYKGKKIRELQVLDEVTLSSLIPKENQNLLQIEMAVTRFNRFTGNGRLQLKGEQNSIAFGFLGYNTVETILKKKIADNLSNNTGIGEIEDMTFLKVECYSYERRDGKVIKYMIKKVL
ncbi:hypothetical protein [Acinetobacter faecalis]|uniref:hypothetical protein n=1 Tax=Acinetobacter faecalis TaxID=2665161 RepID=UPI002A91B543|nr:hypothetical protein [Acinetobacter faecalis]MDY6488448.1 hypothetical protein [Acinetobacter faecalis]